MKGNIMRTFYYIFKVNDSLGQEYYVLNNQYIGYVGYYGDHVINIIEGKKKLKYQLYAKSVVTSSKRLHELNCEHKRLTKKFVDDLINEYDVFRFVDDSTWYKEYFPDKNSSESYLKEIGGSKTIR